MMDTKKRSVTAWRWHSERTRSKTIQITCSTCSNSIPLSSTNISPCHSKYILTRFSSLPCLFDVYIPNGMMKKCIWKQYSRSLSDVHDRPSSSQVPILLHRCRSRSDGKDGKNQESLPCLAVRKLETTCSCANRL